MLCEALVTIGKKQFKYPQTDTYLKTQSKSLTQWLQYFASHPAEVLMLNSQIQLPTSIDSEGQWMMVQLIEFYSTLKRPGLYPLVWAFSLSSGHRRCLGSELAKYQLFLGFCLFLFLSFSIKNHEIANLHEYYATTKSLRNC